MITEFKLPELGENIESCDVVTILVSAGDAIEEDQPVLEIETDKAAIEVPSSVSGVVTKIHVEEGGTAEVGQPILTVDTAVVGETVAETTEDVEPHKPDTTRETPVIEAPTEIPQPPETPAVRAQPAIPLSPSAQQVQPDRLPPSDVELSPPKIPSQITPAAPSVRRFAREIGIDLHHVSGTGPGGRISIEDVKNYARQINTETQHAVSTSTPTGQISAPPLPDFSKWGEIEREAMSNIRRATATHMSAAWSTIPHVTNFDKADITELEGLRKQFQPKAETAGGKLTITAIILKVVASALKVFPKFNASVDMDNNEIIYKKYYHIGIAVDTPAGLLVPVIWDVSRKNIIALSVELGQVAEKARNKKLSLEEMQGGTFTITNLGGIGGTNFSPIINAPEVAILGIARGQIEAVFIDDQLQPRLMLPLALSYDHRLIDGADAARFLRWVVEALEQPFLMTLEG